MKYKLLLCFILVSFLSFGQVLPSTRAVNWSLAGYRGTIPNYSTVVDITAYGGLGDSTSANDAALTNAVNALSGADGIIYFPAGIYLFNAPVNLRSGLILRGAAPDSTRLKFDLGNSSNAISISGSSSTTTALLTSNGIKDSSYIYVDDASGFTAGDYLKLSFNDSSLVFSNWAYGTVGQIIKIAAIAANKIILESPLRLSYDLLKNPKVTKLNMVTGVGIECLKVHRADATPGQTSTIVYTYAAQCWISGIESNLCNFGHIELNNSTNISVKGSYFHDAHAYGGGGQGYGILCQVTTGECLFENNIFKHLRHSMLLQTGANGNVFGYNYSLAPFWTEPSLPSNSAGDMVLHGNYPYSNLFEGNIGQNIVVDDSHGKNGPYNTFFRNRAELYGIFLSNNPASDNQNFIGNEVTNTGFTMGLYYMNGTGHFQHGNNVKGTIYASGTTTLLDNSYYYSGAPAFLLNLSSWPSIGIPNAISSGTIPAKQRYQVMNYTTCSMGITTTIDAVASEELNIFPNPSNGLLYINTDHTGSLRVSIYDYTGNIAVEYIVTGSQAIDITFLSKGIYIVKAATDQKNYSPLKLVLQ
ncbi:MAG: T9SS type A sorting domain-containing protein [Bacteroidota bacterium]